MKKLFTTRFLVRSAAIAAIYAALTMLFEPISYGVGQIRVAEALNVLVFFTPAAIPGLFVGCILANILGGFGLYDIVLGSAATLIAAFLAYRLRSRKWLVPMPAVILNALVIGPMLYYLIGLGDSLWLNIALVGAGQLVACYALGYPLLLLIERMGVHKYLFDTESIKNKP